MITVCFYGDLRQFGRRFKLHVSSPAEALRALLSQVDGLQSHLAKGSYQVRVGGEDYSEDAVKSRFHVGTSSDKVMHIVPRVSGAGKNVGAIVNIVIGIVLVIVSWPAGGAAGWGYMATAGVLSGAAMIAGGVAQLLTKTPSMTLNQSSAEASRNSSFSNTDNTAAQGSPVPLAYGIAYTGSKVVSQGVASRRVHQVSTWKAKVTDDTSLLAALFYSGTTGPYMKVGTNKLTYPTADQLTVWSGASKSTVAQRNVAGGLALKSIELNPRSGTFNLADPASKHVSYFMACVDTLVAGKFLRLEASRSDVESMAQHVVFTLQGETSDPSWLSLSYEYSRTYHTPVAATAPNGQKYAIDLTDDSVLSANYTASRHDI